MNTEIMEPSYAAELMARQEALQSEAEAVLEDLDRKQRHGPDGVA